MSDDVSERFDALESRLDTMSSLVVENDGEIEELQREVSGLRKEYQERMKAVEREIQTLNQSLGFVKQAAAAESSSTEARAALCLQTLVDNAKTNGGNARMDYNGIVNALQGEVHRTTAYDIMREMDRCCSAVTFHEEESYAEKNTRVELRLDGDESVVAQIAGQVVSVDTEGV